MALTVEELQIKLGCDAKEAQDVLNKMDATVKAYTEKFQKYFQTKNGKVAPLDNVSKQIDKAARDVENGVKRIKKAYKDLSEPAYVPSGKKYVGGDANGRGGGMGDPNYFRNSPAFGMTFGDRIPNNELLSYGAQIRSILEDSLGGVDSISKAMRMKIGDALAKLRDLAKAYQEAVQQHGEGSSQANAAEQKFKNAIYAADGYIQKLDNVAAKEQEAEAAAAEEPTKIQAFMDAAREKIDSVRSALSGIRSRLASVGTSIKKAFDHTLLGRFLKRLGTVMMRMAAMKLIRGTIDGIKKGLEELAKTSTSSAKAMNTIKAAGGSIKMALGAAVMPIVKALAPLFVQIAQMATAAGNAIARFFAVLTGQGTYTAVKFSDSLDGVSSSAGSAGKAVKGALASFDELIVIGTQGSGGGGGSGVGSSMSSVLGDLPAFSDLASKIREKIKEGDWRGVGQVVAEKLNEGIGSWDASSSGRTISEKLKNALDIAIGFIETFDSRQLGNKIAEFLANVDWNGVVSKLSELAGGLAGSVAAFFVGLFENAWKNLKEYFAEYSFDEDGNFIITGFLNGVWNAMKNIGTWIYDNIFEPFITGFKKAFGIASPAKEMNEPGEMVGQGILEGIAKPFKAVGTWISEHIIQPIKEWFKTNAISINFDFDVPDLSKIQEAWDNLKAGTKTLTANLAGNAKDAISSLKSKWEDIKTKTATLTASLAGEAKDKLSSLKEKWDDIKTRTATLTASLSESSALKSFRDSWNKLSNKTLTLKAEIADKVKTAWNTAANKWNSSSILSKLGRLPTLASGGLAYGPTTALIGEYSGAGANPEVIAPLSDLLRILTQANAGGSDAKAMAEQNRLLEEQNRLLRDISKNGFKLSPSAALGQVVSRSSQLYART